MKLFSGLNHSVKGMFVRVKCWELAPLALLNNSIQYQVYFFAFNVSDPQENVAHLECHIKQVGSLCLLQVPADFPLLRGRLYAGKWGI